MTGNFKDIEGKCRILEADFNLIKDTAKGFYIEVGTLHGGSAYAASFNADVVHTIDVYKWPHIWKELGRENIFFFKGTAVDFEDFYKLTLGTPPIVDVVFIDAAHEYDYVRMDIEALEPLVKKGGILMFHDYKKSLFTGVKRAVDEYLERSKAEIISKPTEGCSILKVRKV